MSILDYETLMLPLLESVADGREYLLRDLVSQLADRFGLSNDERQQLLPSGQQTIIQNRVSWALKYLKKSGLMISTGRGKVQITDEGRRLLAEKPTKLDARFLERYPSFLEFKQARRAESRSDTATDETFSASDQTPEEAIDSAYRDLRAALADEIRERVRGCSSQFFERLVVELLVAMGYGGSLTDAGRAVGRSGDEGIDGIIRKDKLGLDVVCYHRGTRFQRAAIRKAAFTVESSTTIALTFR
jgi:restriction system protein